MSIRLSTGISALWAVALGTSTAFLITPNKSLRTVGFLIGSLSILILLGLTWLAFFIPAMKPGKVLVLVIIAILCALVAPSLVSPLY